MLAAVTLESRRALGTRLRCNAVVFQDPIGQGVGAPVLEKTWTLRPIAAAPAVSTAAALGLSSVPENSTEGERVIHSVLLPLVERQRGSSDGPI